MENSYLSFPNLTRQRVRVAFNSTARISSSSSSNSSVPTEHQWRSSSVSQSAAKALTPPSLYGSVSPNSEPASWTRRAAEEVRWRALVQDVADEMDAEKNAKEENVRRGN